jgi:hypothetical protein
MASNVIGGSVTMVEETCCSCFMHFAMDRVYFDKLQEDGREFYCPQGHRQWYSESKIRKLQRERDEATKRAETAAKRLAWAEKGLVNAYGQLEDVKKEKAAIKGQLTKTRKRISQGVCPCCHRQIVDMQRHMSSKHPEFQAAVA